MNNKDAGCSGSPMAKHLKTGSHEGGALAKVFCTDEVVFFSGSVAVAGIVTVVVCVYFLQMKSS